MRIACSSATGLGGLTQLEWIEAVAHRTTVDGVAFEARDFPRDDPDYCSQLRKIAVDLGLEIVAIEAGELLDPARSDAAGRLVRLASGCGAPLLRTRLGPPGAVPPEAFTRAVLAAKAVAKAAKAADLTVAVEAWPGTLGATLAEVRHLVKDVDSAWLRYAAPAGPVEGLGPRDHVVLRTATLADDPIATGRRWTGRGPLLLGGPAAEGEPLTAVAAWVKRLRQSTAEAVSISM